MHFFPNLEIVTSIGGESWHGQAQNGVNFYFEVKFDLEGQGQSPPKTIGILTKVFYTYGPNLVILVWTGDELSRGQASAYRTHRRTDGWTHRQTDAGNDNTRRPKLASGNKTGSWFNIKMLSYQYRKSHCRDRTILRLSYLQNGISDPGKITSLYWISVLVSSVSFWTNTVYQEISAWMSNYMP